MKSFLKIFNYLKAYIKAEFHFGMFLSIGIFLAIAIWFNYTYNFERGILGNQKGQTGFFWLNMLYYSVPYLFGCLAIAVFTKNFGMFKKKGFWLVLFIFCFSLSIDSLYAWYDIFSVDQELSYYSRKMVSKVTRALFYLIPIGIYYVIVYKGKGPFFGLTTKGFDKSPYLIMMLIMTPLLIWASFDASFLRSYPTYTVGIAERYLEVNPAVTFIPYQILYALTFVALEILFRGFLIFEMEKHIGQKVVIPMVCVYCTLHFGKPMMECISSIFGGFLLGVIALRTRSVYGGIWVHIFIAVGMDTLAFLQEEYFMQ